MSTSCVAAARSNVIADGGRAGDLARLSLYAPVAVYGGYFGAAIAAHPNKVRQISLGFDLWWEVMASGHVKTATFTKGGVPVDEKDPNIALKVPLAVVGKDMVVSIDVSLAPDDYRLGP